MRRDCSPGRFDAGHNESALPNREATPMRRFVLVSAFSVTVFGVVVPAGADDREAAVAAIQASRQHWDKFQHFSFTYRQYGDDTPPKDLAGAENIAGWKRTKTNIVYYAQNDRNCLFRRDVEGGETPPDPSKLRKDSANPSLSWGRSPTTNRLTSNGNETLHFYPTGHDGQAALRVKGQKAYDELLSTPLHMLGYRNPPRNPYDLMVEADRAGKPWTAGTPTQVNGAVCIPVSFHTPNGFRTVFYLDPARGSVPLRIQEYEQGPDGEKEVDRTDVLELKEYPGGRWFPMRVRFIRFPHVQGRFIAAVKEVTELDPDHRPTNDELAVDVPAGISIVRQDKPQAKYGVTLKRGEKIGPDDLHRIIEVSEARQENPLADTAIVLPKRPWWRYALIATGAVVIAAGATFAVRRRRAGVAT